MKPMLIKHLQGEKQGRFPVWMMRQAGRYLPAYRALREKHSFWEMVSTPSLAKEVSLMPLTEVNVDAIIFFSDILTLPYGLGLPIEMKESIGPVVTTPLRKVDDFRIFKTFDAQKHTGFVGEALSSIRKDLAPEKTLIGFAGAPWTVGCYLVQGQGKSDFAEIKKWLKNDPASLKDALTLLSHATAKYLKAQVEAGAQMVQVFDTWLKDLSHLFFREHYIAILNELFQELRKLKVPVVYFAKGTRPFLPDFYRLNVDVMGCDHEMSMKEFDQATVGKFSLQGNLNPELLLGDEGNIRLLTRKLVDEARVLRKPAIINLGHGILPKTPLANAKAFVDEARAPWL